MKYGISRETAFVIHFIAKRLKAAACHVKNWSASRLAHDCIYMQAVCLSYEQKVITHTFANVTAHGKRNRSRKGDTIHKETESGHLENKNSTRNKRHFFNKEPQSRIRSCKNSGAGFDKRKGTPSFVSDVSKKFDMMLPYTENSPPYLSLSLQTRRSGGGPTCRLVPRT